MEGQTAILESCSTEEHHLVDDMSHCFFSFFFWVGGRFSERALTGEQLAR
jgi:hypothetical protein